MASASDQADHGFRRRPREPAQEARAPAGRSPWPAACAARPRIDPTAEEKIAPHRPGMTSHAPSGAMRVQIRGSSTQRRRRGGASQQEGYRSDRPRNRPASRPARREGWSGSDRAGLRTDPSPAMTPVTAGKKTAKTDPERLSRRGATSVVHVDRARPEQRARRRARPARAPISAINGTWISAPVPRHGRPAHPTASDDHEAPRSAPARAGQTMRSDSARPKE